MWYFKLKQVYAHLNVFLTPCFITQVDKVMQQNHLIHWADWGESGENVNSIERIQHCICYLSVLNTKKLKCYTKLLLCKEFLFVTHQKSRFSQRRPAHYRGASRNNSFRSKWSSIWSPWTLTIDNAVIFPMPGRWQVFVVLLSIAWQLILITEYFTREDTSGRLGKGTLIF